MRRDADREAIGTAAGVRAALSGDRDRERRRLARIAAPGALGVAASRPLARRLAVGRRATRGLAVLADVRRRAALAVLVGGIVGCGLARVWLVLAVAHLDTSPAAAAAAFTALGIFGLLPLGPSAPPAALLVVGGGAGAGALAAGLALSATSIAAVLTYAGALAVAAQVARSRTPGASRTRCR